MLSLLFPKEERYILNAVPSPAHPFYRSDHFALALEASDCESWLHLSG